jgi:type IV secretion system protein TrbG
MRPHTLYIVLLSSVELAACATFRPPEISYDDEPKPAVFQGEPPRPVEVVEIPKPLPLPGQLKAVPGGKTLGPEPKNPTDRVAKANEAARVQPTRNGYINAVQVYPTRPALCTRSIPPPDRLRISPYRKASSSSGRDP